MNQNPLFDDSLARLAALDGLPHGFIEDAKEWYWPLSRQLAKTISSGNTRVIGISGTQGSGKSTLASLLCNVFREVDGFSAVALSIDDFYLTRLEREQLGENVHPLLLSRGVPGTHDIDLALNVINQLLLPGSVKIPRFDKSTDDRKPTSCWEKIEAPVDVVILEGWCLSIPPQSESDLQIPINDLERNEDTTGGWRHFVNRCLTDDYPALFQLIDYFIYLQSPGFESVYTWRAEQEVKLATQTQTHTANNRVMNTAELNRFIHHFERLTRHSFKTLPALADTTFTLNDSHRLTGRVDNSSKK